MSTIKPLARAVEICGSQSELARRVNARMPEEKHIKQQHVWNWLQPDGVVPGEYCRAIEDSVDGEVTRYELREDVFGPAPAAETTRPAPAAETTQSH